MGSEKEQALAHRLQTRRRRGLSQVEGRFLPVVPSTPGYSRFREYVAAREALLLPDRPAKPGMARINPFPATQAKLKRLFSVRPANSGSLVSPIAPRPTPKPVPSPLQAAWDGFAGFF